MLRKLFYIIFQVLRQRVKENTSQWYLSKHSCLIRFGEVCHIFTEDRNMTTGMTACGLMLSKYLSTNKYWKQTMEWSSKNQQSL